jgi:hypothetical protein
MNRDPSDLTGKARNCSNNKDHLVDPHKDTYLVSFYGIFSSPGRKANIPNRSLHDSSFDDLDVYRHPGANFQLEMLKFLKYLLNSHLFCYKFLKAKIYS